MVENDYTVVIQPNPPDEGGDFVALVPDLPGCIPDGSTREEAARNAGEAIAEWLAEARRLGWEIPQPTLQHA